MNSQRGKASTKASAPSKGRQSSKSQTYARKTQNNHVQHVRPPMGRQRGDELDISVAANYARTQRTMKPQITTRSTDSCRIVHRELLANIVSSTNWVSSQPLSINPGITSTFTWLASQAAGWEKYRFNDLRVCYYTRTSSSTAGSVVLAPDYDAADPAPASDIIASSYHGVVEDAPWKNIIMTFDRARLAGERFVRTTGYLAPNLDIKTYDVANLFIGTVDGGNTGVAWGKVWLEYDITLINQQSVPTGIVPTSSIGFVNNSGVTLTNCFNGIANAYVGQFPLAGNGNILTISNLLIGQEYLISVSFNVTVPVSFSLSGLGGAALKTTYALGVMTVAGYCVHNFSITAGAGSCQISYLITAATITSSTVIVSLSAPSPV